MLHPFHASLPTLVLDENMPEGDSLSAPTVRETPADNLQVAKNVLADATAQVRA